MAPSNLHLTVRFIGSIEVATAEATARRVAASAPEAFELEVGGLGRFGPGRRERVIWLGLTRGGAELLRLASAVEAECVRAGLPAETRPLHPHLTLARAADRGGASPTELGEPPPLAPWRATELVLYRSHLRRGGSVYEAVSTIPLA